MDDKIISGLVAIITAVIGIAIIAVLVSKQSQTGSVLTAGGTALSGIIKAAVSPVSGGASAFGGLGLSQ